MLVQYTVFTDFIEYTSHLYAPSACFSRSLSLMNDCGQIEYHSNCTVGITGCEAYGPGCTQTPAKVTSAV